MVAIAPTELIKLTVLLLLTYSPRAASHPSE